MADVPAESIAVVGMACRFPGAPDVAAFWRNLAGGVDSITRFSEEELLAAGVPADAVRDPAYVPARGALTGVDRFDAGLFGYSAREAATMDPQQRLFLECAWAALEDAGHDPERFAGRAGVYGGVGASGYRVLNLDVGGTRRRQADGLLVEIGTDKDYLTTRVSYKLDLRGPSVGVQTACSTSLVAVHLACQGLLTYQCDMALAGGCTVAVPHSTGYRYDPDGILSPEGRCRSYDADGRGTVPGSGVGMVVLRRLSDALAEGDTVWAVIRGSAVNNDGAGKVGFTAPSVDGQAEVIAEAQAVAGVEPGDIGYVEGHGTGTAIGDPIEVRALTQVFGAGHGDACPIGSVKSNVGHLDTAAGVAGLIKTVLALHHGQIPPTLHFERPNPACELDRSPFFVNTRLLPWPAGGRPRLAGVSSFGIGGTNAHVVLEEAPALAPTSPTRGGCVLPLSAATAAALERAAARLAAHLRDHPEQDLADVAYTLQLGRRQLEHRVAVVCEDREEAIAALESGEPRSRGTEPLQAMADQWVAGVRIDWAALAAPERRRRVSLPAYSFERERHWIEWRPAAAAEAAAPTPTLPQRGEGDSRTLPHSGGGQGGGDDLEQVVAAAWQEHLGLDRSIGATENFFALGGHSLIAVGMAADLRDRLRLRVTLATVFENPTIEGMARALAELDRDELEEMLTEVEHLSEEELEAALAAEGDDDAAASLLTEAERRYLEAHEVGRLATVGSGGLPHVVPVNYRWNPGLNAIEVGGYGMAASLKFRHVRASGVAAFVVDDLHGGRPRSFEVRGRAEAVEGDAAVLIRIHPSRVVALGLDGSPGLHSRRVNGTASKED